MSNLRIGIFGGTFDPVHNAHLDIARAALQARNLDLVYFVVAAWPPHKQTITHASPEDRLAMVRAAVENDPRLEPSDVELVREGYSYTVDTIGEFQKRHPGADLFLIIGYDSLLDLPRWKRPDRIIEWCRLLVVPRPTMTQPPAPELEGRYQILPFQQTDLSSTEIRRRVAAGESIEGLVPPAVERFIRQKGIYQEANRTAHMRVDSPLSRQWIHLLRERLSERTVSHCIFTAALMTTIADEVGITNEQAVTAGLLHDLHKDDDPQTALAAAEEWGIVPSDNQRRNPFLLHGHLAAEECRRKLGIRDNDVVDAIQWHTTGKPGLGPVGLALYFADFAEPSRSHQPAAQARDILRREGFWKALLFSSDKKLEHVNSKADTDPTTIEFHRWLVDFMKSK